METSEDIRYKDGVLSSLSRLRADGIFTDFVIEFKEKEIHVHRTVLAVSSRYFENFFALDTKDTNGGRTAFHEIEFATGKQCIDFMYTGTSKFTLKDPEKLLYAAEQMQVPALTKLYLDFLRERLGLDDWLMLVTAAQAYKDSCFAGLLRKLSKEILSQIVACSNFTRISQAVLEQFLEAAAAPESNMEILKWEGLTKWVRSDLPQRKSLFPELFEHINLDKLTENFINGHISSESLITENDRCMKRVFSALCSMGSSGNRSESNQSQILTCHRESRLVLRYNIETEEWSRVLRLHQSIQCKCLDIVSLGDEIFFGTGNVLCSWRHPTNKWLKIFQDHVTEPCYCRCVSSGNCIVMVTRSFVFKYNTETKEKERIEADLGYGDTFAVAASDKFLYAIGTRNTKSAKEFELDSKTWEAIASMHRSQVACVFFDGTLFAFGNSSYREYYLECYNPSTDSWTNLPGISSSFSRICVSKAVVVKDKVYTIEDNKCQERTKTFQAK